MSALPKMVVGITLVGLVAFELASPTLSATKVRGAADNVSAAGAHKLSTDLKAGVAFPVAVADAKKAATAQARSEKVTMSAFDVPTASPVVRVKVSKTAVSLIFKHIPSLRDYDEVTATSTASPR